MIHRSDILSIPFLKKSPFTGSFQGMRYRLEKIEKPESEGADAKEPDAPTPKDAEAKTKTVLLTAVWGEPYSYAATPKEQKEYREFAFSEEGVCETVDWLNEKWKERWEEQ